jgi:hypothetical protein
METRKINPKSWHFKLFKHRFHRKWQIPRPDNRCEYAAEVIKELCHFFLNGVMYTVVVWLVGAGVGAMLVALFNSFRFCPGGFLTMVWFIVLSIGLSILSVYGFRKTNRKYGAIVIDVEEAKFYQLLYDYIIAKKNKMCPPIELPERMYS